MITMQDLKQAITNTFADAEYPRDGNLSSPPADWRTQWIETDLRGVGVHELTAEVVRKHQYRLHLLTPTARRYYLPAFLFGVLNDLQVEEGIPFVLYMLNPPEDITSFKHEYGNYSTAQQQAIRLFLEYVQANATNERTSKTASAALAGFWTHLEPASPLDHDESCLETQVKLTILEVFADMTYPGNEAIADDVGATEIQRDFAGYRTFALPWNVLAAYDAGGLYLLRPEALRYYLPAFLIAALMDFHTFRRAVPHQLAGLAISRNCAALDPYTPTQKHAACLFLEYVRDSHLGESVAIHACIALDFYWRSGQHAPLAPQPIDSARKEQVLVAINNGFAGLPYPADDNIRWHVYDHAIASDELPQTFVDDFRGYPSGDVPLDILEKHIQSLRFSPQAWKFFFPAFLRPALDEAGQLVYWVIDDLMPISAFPTFWMQELNLTLAQRHAVVLFLEYVRDCMPHRSLAPAAQRALDLVWSNEAYQRGLADQD